MRYSIACAMLLAPFLCAHAFATQPDMPGVPGYPDVPGIPNYPDVPGARVPGVDIPGYPPDTPDIPGRPDTPGSNMPRNIVPSFPGTPADEDAPRPYSPEQEKRDDAERDRLDALQRSLSGEGPPLKGDAPAPGAEPPDTPKVPPPETAAAPPANPQAQTPAPSPQQPATQPSPSPPSPAPVTPAETGTAAAPEPQPAAAPPAEAAPPPTTVGQTPDAPPPPSNGLFWDVVGLITAAFAVGAGVVALGPLSTREKPGTGNPNPVPGPGDGPDDPNAQRPTYTETRELVTREGMVKKADAPPQDPSDIPVPPVIYGHDQIVGCCGPDITEKLIGVLKTVIEDYEKLAWYQKAAQWAGFGFWDVEPLRDRLAQIMPANCGQPAGSPCAGTVMLFDRCFEAGVVNYTIYGVIEVLIGGRWMGATAHGAYWLVKEVTGKSSVRMLAAENFMVSVGREFARGGGAGMKEQVQKVKGSPCAKCPLPAKPFHWNYTWAPLFINEPSRH